LEGRHDRKPEGAQPPEGCSLQDSAKTSSSGGSSINFMIRLLDIFPDVFRQGQRIRAAIVLFESGSSVGQVSGWCGRAYPKWGQDLAGYLAEIVAAAVALS
jgi:hypothetical protein